MVCWTARAGRDRSPYGRGERCGAGSCICARSVGGARIASRSKWGWRLPRCSRSWNQAGCGRLDRGDRATAPIVRYERERPGELIHVDVKKLAAIPAGGGWKAHGHARGPSQTGVGYRYIHTALDDRTRIIYSEILNDELGATAAAFWARAAAWFATSASRANVSSPTTARVTSRGSGTGCVPRRTPLSKRPDPADRKPTGRSSVTTGSCSRNGPTSGPGPQNTNARRLQALRPLLQSPPTPRRTRMGNTHQHPQGQPPRGAHLGTRHERRVALAAVMFVTETTGRPGFVVPGLLAAVAAMLVMGRAVGHDLPTRCTARRRQRVDARPRVNHVSRNAVSSQTSSIYRKLGVSSRSEAIASLRELRLLVQ